jgi:hypothetical protein
MIWLRFAAKVASGAVQVSGRMMIICSNVRMMVIHSSARMALLREGIDGKGDTGT